MKELYSIGEISKIFNISIDTIRYYDQLDLLKPIRRDLNGRRYYSKTQFEYISTLLLLKSSGTSLAKINTILSQEGPSEMINELQSLSESLEQKILDLKQLQSQVQVHLENIIDVSNLDVIEIKQLPAIWMLKKDFDDQGALDIQEIERITRSADNEWIYHANIFSNIAEDCIEEQDYHSYKSYGYMSEYKPKTKIEDITKIPSRLYATVNVVSRLVDLSDLDVKYNKLLKTIKQQGYEIDGEVIERSILDLKKEEESIKFFKIYVPVKAIN